MQRNTHNHAIEASMRNYMTLMSRNHGYPTGENSHTTDFMSKIPYSPAHVRSPSLCIALLLYLVSVFRSVNAALERCYGDSALSQFQ